MKRRKMINLLSSTNNAGTTSNTSLIALVSIFAVISVLAIIALIFAYRFWRKQKSELLKTKLDLEAAKSDLNEAKILNLAQKNTFESLNKESSEQKEKLAKLAQEKQELLQKSFQEGNNDHQVQTLLVEKKSLGDELKLRQEQVQTSKEEALKYKALVESSQQNHQDLVAKNNELTSKMAFNEGTIQTLNNSLRELKEENKNLRLFSENSLENPFVKQLNEAQKSFEEKNNDLKSNKKLLEYKLENQLKESQNLSTNFEKELENSQKLKREIAFLNAQLARHEGTIKEKDNQLVRNNEKINILEQNTKALNEALEKQKNSESELFDKKFVEVMDKFSLNQEKIIQDMTQFKTQISSELYKPVSDLKNLFINAQKRGAIGEITLKNILAQILGPEGEMWESQPHIEKSDSKRPDFVIKYVDQRIYIDSKFQEDHEDLKKFQKNFKSHLDKLSKDYVKAHNLDFFIMYVPSEAIFAKLISQKEVVTDAWDKKVVLASPSTIILLLLTIKGFDINFAKYATMKESLFVLENANRAFLEWSEKWNEFRNGLTRFLNNSVKNVDVKARKLQNAYRKLARDPKAKMELINQEAANKIIPPVDWKNAVSALNEPEIEVTVDTQVFKRKEITTTKETKIPLEEENTAEEDHEETFEE